MIGQPLSAGSLKQNSELQDRLLALNNASAQELSYLTNDELIELVEEAFACLHVPEAEALLVAFDQDARYDSPNFRWFQARFDRFVYVDRVVVAATARGRGHASALYRELFELARSAGHERIVCEVNSDPPNPGSDAFHDRMGFMSIGGAKLENGKTVSYFERPLD